MSGRFLAPATVVAAVAAVLLSGCSQQSSKEKPTKGAQCQLLVAAIDKEKAAFASLDGDDANAMMRAAAEIEKAGVTVGSIALHDETLIELRRRYVVMARDVGGASRDTAKAIGKGKEEAITRASSRLSTSLAVRANIEKALQTACGPESGGAG